MQKTRSKLALSSAALILATILAVNVPTASGTFAQSMSSQTPPSATLSPTTIKVLQEALNKQGIPVATDGVLNDDTRSAIKYFQSQHHLPVTGEADKSTLDKLGVAAQFGVPPSSTSSTGQAASPSTASPQAQMPSGQGSGGMMSGPMMEGMMQGMMQTMQGMMDMMQGQTQPGQMGPGTMQPGAMHRGPMQMPHEGATMNCPMMARSDHSSAPSMMQMMQGMMRMMQTMQNQMQSGQKLQGAQ
jgi:Putative peptidoglycan binding domain